MCQQKTENMTINEIIKHTDSRIEEWYVSAKRDYNVKGAGKAHYNKKENSIVVEYTENGVQKTWSMAFYPEYISNGINWIFNCWSELA